MKKPFAIFLFTISAFLLQAQNIEYKTDTAALQSLGKEFLKYRNQKTFAEDFLHQRNLPFSFLTADSSYAEIKSLENGLPVFYTTDNVNSCKTISSNQVWSGGTAGLSLSGNGISLRIWDGGSVSLSHQEITGRSTLGSGQDASVHYHAAHVAGTMIASGVNSSAKGHAYDADLVSFDWNFDIEEISDEVANGMLLSNHSYGIAGGWEGTIWYGDPVVSLVEDYRFGYYNSESRDFDLIANAAPYYLLVVSAGNDRDDTGPSFGGSYTIYATGATGTANGTEPQDDGPYDCLDPGFKTAKNSLVVGSVSDISAGYVSPSDISISYFSSFGPTDDGRIKPDIVTNGASLTSCGTGTTNYEIYSGTSMAAPGATGASALLQEHHNNLFGTYMLASTLKAVLIHTTDKAFATHGPSYSHGWGLMNTKSAALLISDEQNNPLRISELTLAEGQEMEIDLQVSGSEPLKITMVWNDPAGNVPAIAVDPSDTILVNDLDLRLLKTGTSSLYYPYKLDKINPSAAATTGDNMIDNVEYVYLETPEAGEYNLKIQHKNSLSGGNQVFSLILSGATCTSDSVLQDVTINSGETYTLPDGMNVSIAGAYVSVLQNIFGCDSVITTNLSVTPTCAVPAGVYAANITATSAKIFWDAVSSATKYQVYYRPVGTTTWLKKSSTLTNKKLNGLLSTTIYEYKVRAFCSTFYGDFSTVQNFTTLTLKADNTNLAAIGSSAFTIYPNPNNGSFSILTNLEQGEVFIEVFDVTGQLLLERVITNDENPIELKMEEFKGIAVIRVTGDWGSTSQNVVILD